LATEVGEPPPEEGRTLLSADVSMLVEHKKPFFLEAPLRYIPRRNANPQRFVRTYRFESRSQTIAYRNLAGRRAGDPRWTEAQRQYYLVGPSDPRYRALAQEIVGKLAPAQRLDPFMQALAVKLHFDQTLTYSTKHRHAGVEDPTADFLFGDKIGYCVHFAHAAVYLWRSLGIPARISAGYATTEDDRLGATIVIQSGDAHSWPELYLEGVGWVVLDISAQQNLDPPTPPPDEELMRKLADMAREESPEPEEEPEMAEEEGSSRPSGSTIALALLLVVLAVVIGLYLIKIWRRVVPWLASARAQPRVSYRLALDLLSEAGLSRRYGETRICFAERVADRVPCFHRLTEMNLAARFGDPAVPTGERGEFRKRAWRDGVRQLRRELSQRTKTWRRLLGLCDPASFFASR
ncbi:MAG: transglutaminase domain-containing protein, partial [Deltaproteobacteria bacterium]|nr:transglutaminase domain-containing protein [Deltaproteobacteria bacterium]MBW2536293.1 transglutaminase domain-containing protein [Deltaproteobacteria bacterium]